MSKITLNFSPLALMFIFVLSAMLALLINSAIPILILMYLFGTTVLTWLLLLFCRQEKDFAGFGPGIMIYFMMLLSSTITSIIQYGFHWVAITGCASLILIPMIVVTILRRKKMNLFIKVKIPPFIETN